MTRTRKLVALLLLAAVVATSGICIALATDETETYAYLPDHSVYFYDVTENYAWVYREVDALALNGVVQGGGDHLFHPDNQITRADFVVMLDRAFRMSALLESGVVASQGSFSDVPAGRYYSQSVEAAKAFGVANGTEDGLFHPTASITRQDAMVLLKRALDRTDKTLGLGTLSAFSDANQVSTYAQASVASLVDARVIGGANGQINPRGRVTRAQMAVMLYRALHLDENARYVQRSDVVNLCIGARVYSDVVIENYDAATYYGELMRYTTLRQQDGTTYITLGEHQPIDRTAVLSDGQMTFNDPTAQDANATVTYPVASDCIAVNVSPYHQINRLESTGGTYRYCYPSIVNGQVSAVYYIEA